MHLQDADEGLEQRPIEAVAVKMVRCDVRCGDQHHAVSEQRRKQPRQDHRVGNVGHAELVEAQKVGLIGNRPCHRWNGVIVAHKAILARLPVLLDAVMRIGHEVIEMDAPLAPHRRQFKKHVHEHGLATADAAMDVEPLDGRRFRLLGEEPAERARLSGKAIGAERIDQAIQCHDDVLLRRIAGNRASLDQMIIALSYGSVRLKAVAQMHGRAGDRSRSAAEGNRNAALRLAVELFRTGRIEAGRYAAVLVIE